MPIVSNRHKICIICEGDEEYDYLERLNSLGVWHQQYKITLDNANGNGNILARYQDRYQNGSYELILVFCDTDKKPYEQYEEIKRRYPKKSTARNKRITPPPVYPVKSFLLFQKYRKRYFWN